MRPFLRFMSIASLSAILAACGTKGPLYLPPPPQQSAPPAAASTPTVDHSTAKAPAQ